jgi:predicted Zn-dependent protease with MMP-like domain
MQGREEQAEACFSRKKYDMDHNEQIYHEEEAEPSKEEFDYNREPQLDNNTTRMNRSRSKYVFMTLCFLFALVFLYTYINGTFDTSNSTSWFPLLAAIALIVMGIVFLRSPDSPPKPSRSTDELAVSDTVEAQEAPQRTLSPFEELVREALATLPAEFQEQMENLTVRVAYEPDEETLARVGISEGRILLGLYEGTPLTTYGRANFAYPEVITIYQRSIERYCQSDPKRIREQVRKTVLHELAHHFGIGHEEMPIWVQ